VFPVSKYYHDMVLNLKSSRQGILPCFSAPTGRLEDLTCRGKGKLKFNSRVQTSANTVKFVLTSDELDGH